MMKIMIMKEYSREKINFTNLNLQKIIVFLNILRESQQPTLNYLQGKFKNFFTGFEDVLLFLIDMGLIKINDNKIKLKDDLSLNKNELTDSLLKIIFSNPFYRKSELAKFINFFVFKSGEYWFSRDKKLRLKTSGIRNFLINLGFLVYDKENDNYFISKKGIGYLSIILSKQNLTPRALFKKLKDIEELGIAAEEVVLKYEKSRLKKFPALLKKIRHISKEKVNAGYDIQSYSLKLGSEKPHLRYIEVKAVSELDKKFYWSRNEIAVAENLGDEYYLYLVPVKAKNKFDIKNLVIVQNPYEKVLRNKDKWNSEIELMSFVLK